MISPEKLDGLQRSWVNLLAGFDIEPAAAYPAFDRLVAAHDEPHRRYHTLEHLAEMFRVVSRLSRFAADLKAVQLAVWFHDVVYDPTARDNEARSAAWAESELIALGLPADAVAAVQDLILSTAHLLNAPTVGGADADVLHDADLAVLGASEIRYDRYAADIRAEYGHVAEMDYRRGRAAVLQHFLDLPTLYRTPLMIDEGEAAARRNLHRELAALHGDAETAD